MIDLGQFKCLWFIFTIYEFLGKDFKILIKITFLIVKNKAVSHKYF
jgi:hypothetical protein